MGKKEAVKLFCPACGSMMSLKDGVYTCNGCGATKDVSGKSEIITTSSRDKEITVISEEDTITLPKTHVLCPQCKYTEAYYMIRQTRAADEPETMIYRCCKCNHSWREY